MSVARDEALRADAADPLRGLRHRFVLPPGRIYLLGNSLGALPVAAPAAFDRVVREEWGAQLIDGWNAGWYDAPVVLGDRVARLIGASPGEVVVADTTSSNLMKVVHAALTIGRRTGRGVVGYDAGMFPTDIYVTESVAAATGASAVPLTFTDGALPADLSPQLAAVVISHVDYRTGRLLDMGAITTQLHARGILAIWDLSHSAGAVPVALDASDVDYAVGCTYKYLNAGPGAPAFVFVRERLLADTVVLPAGWFAHREPFAMAAEFVAADDIRRMLVGTPPVIASTGLAASLDIFDDVDLRELRAKSLALSDLFVETLAVARAPVQIVTPPPAAHRGAQISLRHASAYPVVRNLAARGVIGDFREPDIMRFGFAALYTRYVDAYDAATALVDVLASESFRDPAYAERTRVT